VVLTLVEGLREMVGEPMLDAEVEEVLGGEEELDEGVGVGVGVGGGVGVGLGELGGGFDS
jgi:hypothetical protein